MIYDDVLFDYQKVAVDRMVERGCALLADQPGLGKTLEILGALEKLELFSKSDAMTLILSPIVACQTAWRDSIEKFVQTRHDVAVLDLSSGSSAQKSARMEKFLAEESKPAIVLANHGAVEIVNKKPRVVGLHDLHFDAVVVDESHMVLPILNDRKLTNFWRGLNHFVAAPYRFAVSGTPDRGKLENRYGTYRFLMPGRYAKVSRWAWIEENFWVTERQVARNRTVKLIQSLRNPVAWSATEDDVIIRRTKLEVLKDLPPKQYNFVEVELYKEQRQAYMNALKAMSEEKIAAAEDERDTAAAMLFSLRGRQITSCQWENGQPVVGGKSAKLDWLLEWLAEREDPKVVVSSQFSQVLHWLKKELDNVGISCAVLDGSASSADRAAIQNSFQNGRLAVVLLSGRMGVGITLDAADDLVMWDQPYDPDMIEQIEDRIHRASRNHQVTIWTLIGIGSIDQAIAKIVSKRYVATRELMDGRRGLDIEKKVLENIRVLRELSPAGDSIVNS